jgi:hypothetical protein
MLEDAPIVTPRLQLALLAFGDLFGERPIGMALGPISWRAIVAWSDRYQVPDREGFIELVQVIDREWLRAGSDNAATHKDKPAH